MTYSQPDPVPTGNIDVDLPPPFKAQNVIVLSSSSDGRITHVRVYSHFAEVTRVFKIPVKVGNNQVVISGIPDVIKEECLRHEIEGAASIREVTVSQKRYKPNLEYPKQRREQLLNSLTREYKGLSAIEDYLKKQTKNSAGNLMVILNEYEDATSKLDRRIAEIKEDIADIDKEIAEAESKLDTEMYDYRKATVGIFAEIDCEVDLTLHYGVSHAGWESAYDVFLDTQAKETRLTVIYKASIRQSTGESWDNVPITLDLATYADDCGLSSSNAGLHPWTLRLNGSPQLPPPPAPDSAQDDFQRYIRLGSSVPWRPNENILAALEVPGLRSIASNDLKHILTVRALEMDAETFWYNIPRKYNNTMNYKMKVKNTTKYPLKSGTANIFVNGSLVSNHLIPLVLPNGTFECPLGADSSIITEVHPISQTVTHSNIFLSIPFKRKTTYTFTRKISVLNTNSYPVSNVQILDQIPTTYHDSIRVRLLYPSLPAPGPGKAVDLDETLSVSEGVVVKWANMTNVCAWRGVRKLLNTSGAEDGLVNWTCSIPAHEQVAIMLKWEMKAPKGRVINQLYPRWI